MRRNIKKVIITEHTTMYAYQLSRKMGEKEKWEYWKNGTISGILYYGEKENMEGRMGMQKKGYGKKGREYGKKRKCGK